MSICSSKGGSVKTSSAVITGRVGDTAPTSLISMTEASKGSSSDNLKIDALTQKVDALTKLLEHQPGRSKI